MRAVLDLTDAAYYLHMTAYAVDQLVKQKQIPYKKRGDRVIFLVAELDAWLQVLPGLGLDDIIRDTKQSDTFSDTYTSETPREAPIRTEVEPPIPLRRGHSRKALVEKIG